MNKLVKNAMILGLVVFFACPDSSDAQWLEQLPRVARQSIIWSADHEEGDLSDWEYYDFQYPGGGVFNTGGLDVIADTEFGLAHSGVFSARARITNAYRTENGKRAVRLMRWTDRPWDDAGFYFPQAAYYSTWIYFPRTYNPNKYAPWDPGDGGWWNIFQFKANDENGESQPVWTLNVDHNDTTGQMSLYLYSSENNPSSHGQAAPRPLPVGKWVHVEAFYRTSAENTGRIAIWQDGVKILDVDNVKTAMSELDENAIWGIGNYTDHIEGGVAPGTATIYFDDSVVSTRRISAYRVGSLKSLPSKGERK